MKLTNLVAANYNYYISKVYDGIHSDLSPNVAKIHFNLLKDNFEEIVAKINDDFADEDLPGVEHVVNKINYIISRLKEWVDDGQLYDNQEAEVFLDGFNDRFKEFKGMLKELDEAS